MRTRQLESKRISVLQVDCEAMWVALWTERMAMQRFGYDSPAHVKASHRATKACRKVHSRLKKLLREPRRKPGTPHGK